MYDYYLQDIKLIWIQVELYISFSENKGQKKSYSPAFVGVGHALRKRESSILKLGTHFFTWYKRVSLRCQYFMNWLAL